MEIQDAKKYVDIFQKDGHSREETVDLISALPVNGERSELFEYIEIKYQTTPCRELTEYNLTDAGNAEYFTEQYGNILRYDHQRGRWLQWHTHCWRPENDGNIMRLALRAARSRYKEAVNVADLELRERISKWAIQSEQRFRLEACIAIASNLKPIADSGEHWDADGCLFCVKNGVIDLHTGSLRPGKPDDMITMQSPVTFEPEAKAPRWTQFIKEVSNGDSELEIYLQRGVGYSLTAETKAQLWFFLYGLGTNGKTTFTMTIRRLMGDYGVRIDSEDLMIRDKKSRGSNPKEGVADTRGKRYAVASEVQDGKKLDIGLLKDMSGQDSIKARRLYEHELEFIPTHKLWMFGNHKPIITDTTHAAWRRLKLIPFIYTVPDGVLDLDLQSKMEDELPGILNWAITGCLEWRRENFNEPGVVTDAVAAYRHDSDILADFLEDCCIFEHMATVSKSELKATYENWCKENGQDPVTRNTFKNRLMEKGIGEQRSSDGNIRLWVGIREKTKDGDGQIPDISDKTLKGFETNLTKLPEFPTKSPREERKSYSLQETDKTFVSNAPAGDMPPYPDKPCPKCGSEWTLNENGTNYICSECKYELK